MKNIIVILVITSMIFTETEITTPNDSLQFNISHQITHLSGHLILPLALAYVGYTPTWQKTSTILLSTNIVDIDHLIADPIYDSDRCSLGYHPLHSIPAIGVYSGMLFNENTQQIGVGLLTHMAVDYIDCINTKERLGTLKFPKYFSNPVNHYSLGHLLFWAGMAQIPEINSNTMIGLSLGWEILELYLPFEFAQESYLNKTCDLIFNALGYYSGRKWSE